jgi:hypothetical protein
MNASPLIQEIVEESKRTGQVEVMLHLVQGRLGPVGPEISAGLAQVKDKKKLLRLSLHAVTCRSLQAFEEELRKELPAPAQPSTRRKRRPHKPST